MEPRFGHDFSQVRVHTDGRAARAARAVNAASYTVGRNLVFAADRYAPQTGAGRYLLAHELTHVLQQGAQHQSPGEAQTTSSPGDAGEREADRVAQQVTTMRPQRPHARFTAGSTTAGLLQRTIGDGHDLTSSRFSLIEDLEAAYDDEEVIEEDDSGRGVQAIQQALYDLGFGLPRYGADGEFGTETKTAVKAFQRANPPLADDGQVGDLTMAALDARFAGTPTLPAAASRTAPWDADSPAYTCVRSLLCPWSPHTVEVLRTRITLKSFDSMGWADERWNGAGWDPAPFPGGGYNTGTEIGVVNCNCEEMAQVLYHEVLHAEQPRTHRTTRDRENYAYRIGEEYSIYMGLGGRPGLRSTDARGREYADPTKVATAVAADYPSIPASGANEEIIGKAEPPLGQILVERPNGSRYTRPAVVGEKVEGPITTVHEASHPTAGWTCP
jgi:hypothetical protein